jgi:hypothetical protein
MGAWDEHQETEARLQALDARAKKTRRDFERLNRETPDEEKDEQGWTPGLLAAVRAGLTPTANCPSANYARLSAPNGTSGRLLLATLTTSP